MIQVQGVSKNHEISHENVLSIERYKKENEFDSKYKILQLAVSISEKMNLADAQKTKNNIQDFFFFFQNLIEQKENIPLFKQKNINLEDTINEDYIVCLEDGKQLKTLNRHLKAHYNISFEEYKAKWGLPLNYPSVCKNYSEVRKNIASKK